MEIMVWPDNSWMEAEDYEDVLDQWRGDDFTRLRVPERAVEGGEEEIVRFVDDWREAADECDEAWAAFARTQPD